MKVLITTIPFGEGDKKILEMIKKSEIDFKFNKTGKKLTSEELILFAKSCDAIIAGTDKFDEYVLSNLPNLKFISRVGVGIDSIDLDFCKNSGIKVSNTPIAPVRAVAELTIGLIFSLLRSIHLSDSSLKSGTWKKEMGKSIDSSTVGIVGNGRIGKEVINLLSGLCQKEILVHDPIDCSNTNPKVKFVSKEEILSRSDILSLHIPLTQETKGFISKKELLSMKEDAYLINTARGGIINEDDLYKVLSKGSLSGVALDVFENEPYDGPLKNIQRCLLTPHLGPMTFNSRNLMEMQALDEIIRFANGRKLNNLVLGF